MSKNYERAKELLDNLGTRASRPTPRRIEPHNGYCKYCKSGNVVWATAPSGSRVPLDVHPEGPIVLRDGVAVELPANEGERRFCLHFEACRRATGGTP